MNNLRYSLIFLFLLISLVGCGPDDAQRVEEITVLEDQLYSKSDKFDKNKANDLLVKYEEFIANHKEHEKAKGYLYSAAETANSLMQFKKAINLYGTYSKRYAEDSRAASCVFIQGFIYENHIGDLGMAERHYKMFLEKYPDHELAKDAKFSIDNLGKSVEELLKQFEAKQDSANT
ncbi:MAG: hypothetical protein COC01_04500 [Bacteroidetes bacterium]|nr:hypothetical protein [Bacteroidia bacterium]PCH68089.1 MAG: hypothetical protein COC01_04500 [Bacteroidota bacterium]